MSLNLGSALSWFWSRDQPQYVPAILQPSAFRYVSDRLSLNAEAYASHDPESPKFQTDRLPSESFLDLQPAVQWQRIIHNV